MKVETGKRILFRAEMRPDTESGEEWGQCLDSLGIFLFVNGNG